MKHYRDTVLNVNLDNFDFNYKVFEQTLDKDIFTVVKANAYGLGALHIALEALALGTKYLCTATLDEALALRQQGVQAPILVMGYTDSDYCHTALEHNITLTVPSLTWAQEVSKLSLHNLKLHIKYNTGMNRLGLNNADEVSETIDLLSNHHIEGIFTHYYAQDEKQIHDDFSEFKAVVESVNYHFTWIHASNSFAGLNYHETFTNAARIGIGLYGGLYDERLRNVATLKTKVVLIRPLKQLDTVSYDGLLKLPEDSITAVLPVGYADGFNRLNFKHDVYINNQRYPIIGSVCMDQTIIKIDDSIKLNDPVELFGEHITIFEKAELQNTISYEVLTSISARVPRVYYKNQTCIDGINYLI